MMMRLFFFFVFWSFRHESQSAPLAPRAFRLRPPVDCIAASASIASLIPRLGAGTFAAASAALTATLWGPRRVRRRRRVRGGGLSQAPSSRSSNAARNPSPAATLSEPTFAASDAPLLAAAAAVAAAAAARAGGGFRRLLRRRVACAWWCASSLKRLLGASALVLEEIFAREHRVRRLRGGVRGDDVRVPLPLLLPLAVRVLFVRLVAFVAGGRGAGASRGRCRHSRLLRGLRLEVVLVELRPNHAPELHLLVRVDVIRHLVVVSPKRLRVRLRVRLKSESSCAPVVRPSRRPRRSRRAAPSFPAAAAAAAPPPPPPS